MHWLTLNKHIYWNSVVCDSYPFAVDARKIIQRPYNAVINVLYSFYYSSGFLHSSTHSLYSQSFVFFFKMQNEFMFLNVKWVVYVAIADTIWIRNVHYSLSLNKKTASFSLYCHPHSLVPDLLAFTLFIYQFSLPLKTKNWKYKSVAI